jgi:hypothetical protein
VARTGLETRRLRPAFSDDDRLYSYVFVESALPVTAVAVFPS